MRNYEPPQAVADDARYSMETRLIRTLMHAFGNPPIAFALWNGDRIAPLGSAPVATLRIADRRTLLRLCTDPDVQFGELYSAGKIDVEGDLVRMIEELYRGGAPRRAATRSRWRGVSRSGCIAARRNTLTGSRENIHHHYDIGNEFYSLWLGETMAYTCAYFPTPTATLDEAQIAKMDHVCRKLRLRAGRERGRGGLRLGRLALHMARHYGVQRAGVQHLARADRVRARAREGAGLDRRVEFIEDDYRNITRPLRRVRLGRHARARRRRELPRARARSSTAA